MKKAIIITACLGLLLFGSNRIHADEVTGSDVVEVQNIDKTETIDQPFKITPKSLSSGHEESNLFKVTINWKINSLDFEIANEKYNDGYIYNPVKNATSKQAKATFTISNNSFYSLKVNGSFTKAGVFENDTDNISYQFNTGKSSYLTGFFEQDPGQNESCAFYVGGWKLFDGIHTRELTSTVTVNENLFKNYTGEPTGAIGSYHIAFSKA